MSGQRRAGFIVTLVILIGVLFIIGSWYINTRNRLITLEESINSAWAEIDNQLQRRSDLIPSLVNTVRGYASHEQEVFTAIADARARMAGAESVQEAAEGYNEMQSALSRLMVVVEQYPDLKANESFIRLQDELAGTENRIAVARRRYNEQVRQFNTGIRTFPGSLFAGSLGLYQRDYFEIDESARTAPRVDFGS